MRSTRLAAILAIAALAALAAPAPASALGIVGVRVARVTPDSRDVLVRVDFPAGSRIVVVSRDGTDACVALVSTGTAVSALVPVPGAVAALTARSFDASGVPTGVSGTLVVRAIDYAPRVGFGVPSGRMVGAGEAVRVDVRDALDAEVRYANPRLGLSTTIFSGEPTQPIAAAAPDWYGANNLSVVARNAWGARSAWIRLWHLHAGPSGTRRYALVDKSDFTLYLIGGYQVAAAYPIAIGMYGTPTPTGTFKLGGAQAGGGPWGALRMPLYRILSSGALSFRGYYIHGTDDPESIGTPASHGCVRMYNSHVRRLAGQTGSGTRVIIRE